LEAPARSLDLEAPLQEFERQGYARLGRVLSQEALHQLRERADDLMLGRVTYPGLFYQHDSGTGRYEDLERRKGWVGPSRAYRKLEKLELDPVFLRLIENPLFARIAHAVLGADVTLYRAVLWNKAANGGVDLPWHQDDGTFWGLDRSPKLQIWTALDDASVEAGCVEVVPGSHRGGLATKEGGTVPDWRIDEADRRLALPVPARAGECLLIHNHVWHRSGRNTTGMPRRAIGISFLSAATTCRRRRSPKRAFRPLFASGAGSGYSRGI
jgi:phytanoyl-CoA hydroxylase